MANRIGIRREDKNEWERRAPLVPDDVKALAELGVDIRVERFKRRALGDSDYARAGATLVDDIKECDLVLGIKEMPVAFFKPGGAYMFFSHTIKGQRHNMPMLYRLKELGCTLLDYETVTDDQCRRLIFFGRYAGLAGMIDTLWTYGQRLEKQGHSTPLAQIKKAHEYASLEQAKKEISLVGEAIAKGGIPGELAPLVIGITGYGNVSSGAQDILAQLPCQAVSPPDLAEFIAQNQGINDRIIKVVYREEHLAQRRNWDGPFILSHYYAHGELYDSIFEEHLSLLSVLVNGIFWNDRYPRLASAEQLRRLWQRPSKPRLQVAGDISCDIDGSLACTVKDTGPGDPVYMYDPTSGEVTMGLDGDGLAVMAVSNLPSELPLESSNHFSGTFSRFVPALAEVDFSAPFDQASLPPALERSVIMWQGEFTKDYKYMEKYLADPQRLEQKIRLKR